MRQKMIPPLPADLGEAPSDRFKRFTQAVLAVPKAEVETPEQSIARLETEKQQIERKITEMKRAVAKRNVNRKNESTTTKVNRLIR
jgi:hypothetical protein